MKAVLNPVLSYFKGIYTLNKYRLIVSGNYFETKNQVKVCFNVFFRRNQETDFDNTCCSFYMTKHEFYENLFENDIQQSSKPTQKNQIRET